MTAIAYPVPSVGLKQPQRINPEQSNPALSNPVQSNLERATFEQAALERREDIDLLALVAAGSRQGPSHRERAEGALATLYAKHSRNVYGLARRIVRDLAAAEEIVQDVFMKLWQHAPQFDARRGAVSTWLMTIAHHASIDHLRRVTSKPVSYPEEPVLEAIPDHTQPHERLDSLLIGDAMRALRPIERELIELAYFEGLTHSQIASRISLPLGTVKTRIRTALVRLRDQLEPER